MSSGAYRHGRKLANKRAAENPDPFLTARQIMEREKEWYDWKILAFVPVLVCFIFIGVFMFSPVADWLVSKSVIFHFLLFDGGHYYGWGNLVLTCMVVWACTAITIHIINILMYKDNGEQGVNPFTYINSKTFSQFVADVYDRPIASNTVRTERKRYDESQAYQYTGRPSCRKAKPKQAQADINENIEPIQCPNFDLPEFDPDGPNPFA